MQHLRYPEDVPEKECATTLGFFDGVHLGHQTILHALKKTGLPTVVMTFRVPPKYILSSTLPPPLLTSFEEKLKKLASHEIDYVYELPATHAFFSLRHSTFLEKICAHVPIKTLILGRGASFGKERAGTEEEIKKIASAQGFVVCYLPLLMHEGKIVSSTRIRSLVEKNSLIEAKTLLKIRTREKG
ncbi:MAG: FAD synthetase family protein [Chlamydiota bacterium]